MSPPDADGEVAMSAVLVAVDGRPPSRQALEWAAAEAAAGDQALYILHVVECPLPTDANPPHPDDRASLAVADGERILEEARRRAREIAPDLRITCWLDRDTRPARSILRAAVHASLVVLGRRGDDRIRSSRVGSSVGSSVARQASAPVVIAGLVHQPGGPAVGRVAVLVDDGPDAFDVLGIAFRAADRRGIGVTVLHAGSTRTARRRRAAATLVASFRGAFTDVDVAEAYLATSAGPELAAASQGAALLVLRARPPRRLQRRQLRAIGRSVAEARTPVLIIPATNAA
jgi:nucleotide-binding universal stress UspA family protein